MIKLIFVHGWGFDASVWDAVAARLRTYAQARFDFGFFGTASPDLAKLIEPGDEAILVGHSLGFLYGIQQNLPWVGWIAINGFTRFVPREGRSGCVPLSILRDMQRRLAADPEKTLAGFHWSIGTKKTAGIPDLQSLEAGLDILRDNDIDDVLARCCSPGLVLAGQQDPLVPAAMSAELGAAASEFRFDAQGGHVLPQSHSQWCAQQIDRFISLHLVVPETIGRRFNAAAHSYDAAAGLQSEVAAALVQQVDPTHAPRQILDLGCGTGYALAQAAQRWPDATLTGLDAAPAMLAAAKRRVPAMTAMAGDAAHLTLMPRYDLIVSSLMLHWLPQPRAALQRWQAGLVPGGTLAVTLLGAESFKEWRALCAAHDVVDALWAMPDAEFVADLASEARTKNQVISYGSAHDFLRNLKKIGAATPRPHSPKIATGRLRQMLAAAPKPFTVTYQILYVTVPSSAKV